MVTHLLEIRRRLMWVLVAFVGFFSLFFLYADYIFHFIAAPLINSLPTDHYLIATQLTSTVLIPISLAADLALVVTAPFALFQLWCFIGPGLYKREQYQIKSIIFLSLGLFSSGVLFCFYIVLPFMFQFFIQAVPPGVKMMPDMAYALNFITYMLLIFGLCFQVPLICSTLVAIEWLDLQALRRVRPYVIVAAFIVGMLLTPPDVMSQIMLAVPLCLLYELGIILVLTRSK